jgi:hypothetical protein
MKYLSSFFLLCLTLFSTTIFAQSTVDVPGLISAENYKGFYDTTAGNTGGQYRNDNVDIENTTDAGGYWNVGWIATGEWLEYPINVTKAGAYKLEVRVASPNNGGMFTMEIGGATVGGGAFTVNSTGGWQTWASLSKNISNLTTGNKTLRFQVQAGGFNVNWFRLSLLDGGPVGGGTVGKFNVSKDLFLAQFDTKPDVDDIHSQAAVGTMLKNSRLAGVKYFAVAGAFGNQGGAFIDSSAVMNLAFPNNWASAASNYAGTLTTVVNKAKSTLSAGGDVWIAEAGQSNFTAAMIRRLQNEIPNVDTRIHVHVVQHSAWNEQQTSSGDLSLVKGATQYNKIPDGNTTGNGSPGFSTGSSADWNRVVSNAKNGATWKEARNLANAKNTSPNAFINQNIKNGGFDFSDAAETTWIFGFNGLFDGKAFFDTFL